MPRPTHVHKWQMRIHMDFCHYATTLFACDECGAVYKRYDERDTGEEDSYALIWLLPETCDRCKELMKGATAVHHTELERAS